jgi:hypothetical protein
MTLVLVLLLATSASALETKAFQMREDFGTEPLFDASLCYYYSIPCPTYSWYWAFSGWTVGEILGACFNIGDEGTAGGCLVGADPDLCHELEQIVVLDFAGYGTQYPGLFTIEFDVYCAPEACCGPTSPYVHLWNSGPLETRFGWNYFTLDPPLCLSPCWEPMNFPVVITATHTGSDGGYPAWATDNISTPLSLNCTMHDASCIPAVYPRTSCGGLDPEVHSGYIGTYPFQYWPPLCLCDGQDTTPDCTQFGCVELAWRIHLICAGPTAAGSSTWGQIKSLYR